MTPKLLAVAALAGSLPLAVPAPVPPQSQFQRHWDTCVEQGRKRVNGVLMTAKVKEHTADKLVVEWGFDYTGPRPPLTILSPVRPDSKDLFPYAAAVSFFAVGADGFPYMENYANAPKTIDGQPVPGESVRQRRDYYLTIEKGKTATVEVTVPIREHLKRFKERYPAQFKQPPAKLYFLLVHQPKLRGELFDFDAWTGVLTSEPVLLNNLQSWN
jgi:hypothetical protein